MAGGAAGMHVPMSIGQLTNPGFQQDVTNYGIGWASGPGTSLRRQQDLGKQQAEAAGAVYIPGTRGNTGFAGGGGGSYGSGGGGGGDVSSGGAIVQSKGSGGGSLNLSRDAYERQQEMLLKQKMADSAFSKIKSTGAGDAGGRVNYGGSDSEAARSAVFARAKEQAGLNAQAALKSMQDVMGGRGLRGSSIEAGGIADVLQGGSSDIAGVVTQQMEDELGHIRHVDDTTYQGGLTMRGQDMQAKQAMASLLAGLY